MKILIKILIVFYSLISMSLRGQDKNNGTVISDKNLTSFYFDSLNHLFDDIKVIGVGESTHGTHEFSILRSELFKHLVQNCGFNTFFLEASYSSCLKVDNYINGSNDDLYDIMVNLRLWPWQTNEMMSLIEWMKSYNTKNPNSKLTFVGIDMRYNYKSTIEELKYLNPKLLNISSNLDSLNLSQKKTKIDSIKFFTYNPTESSLRFKYDFLLNQLDQFYEGELKKRPKYYRDMKMGQNIISYIESNQNVKGMFWAHNGHIKKTWIGFLKKEGRAGGYLYSILKDKYIAIGQDFKIGTFNVHLPDSTSNFKINGIGYSFGTIRFDDFSKHSLVESLQLDSLPKYFSKCEIKKASAGKYILINEIGAKYTPRPQYKKARANYNRYQYHKVKEFDGIIYIPESTPTKMIKRRKN